MPKEKMQLEQGISGVSWAYGMGEHLMGTNAAMRAAWTSIFPLLWTTNECRINVTVAKIWGIFKMCMTWSAPSKSPLSGPEPVGLNIIWLPDWWIRRRGRSELNPTNGIWIISLSVISPEGKSSTTSPLPVAFTMVLLARVTAVESG